jgi:hypothetical protein
MQSAPTTRQVDEESSNRRPIFIRLRPIHTPAQTILSSQAADSRKVRCCESHRGRVLALEAGRTLHSIVLAKGESIPSQLPYQLGAIHATILLGIAALEAIYGAVGFLFTRFIILLVIPVLTGAIGYGLLHKRRFAVFLLCIVTVVGGIFMMQSLFGNLAAASPFQVELAPVWWMALTVYWLPFAPYYARRWAEFR